MSFSSAPYLMLPPYNCFYREFSVLANLIFGVPILCYYDDFGGRAPEILGRRALSTIIKGAELSIILFDYKKSEWENTITFVGLLRPFPRPESGVSSSISPPSTRSAVGPTFLRTPLLRGDRT